MIAALIIDDSVNNAEPSCSMSTVNNLSDSSNDSDVSVNNAEPNCSMSTVNNLSDSSIDN